MNTLSEEAAHRFALAFWSFALSLALLVSFALPVHAHSLNMTGVRITLGNQDTQISVMAHLHQLRRDAPATDIRQRLKLRFDGEAFVPQKPQITLDKANGIILWQAEFKGRVERIELEAPIFPEKANQTTTLSVIKNRQVWKEALLDANHPSAIVDSNESDAPSQKTTGSWEVFTGFLRQGIWHIFLGPDHVLFLLSLLLLGGKWKHLIKIVTAFTLAHSITLSLAATGTFSLPPRFVEPVIALSIVAVALFNLKQSVTASRGGTGESHRATPQRDYRPWLAFGFGLLHGFGFAGALAEVGLPREALGLALLAFNLGVEIGQATIVLLFCPLLAVLVRQWPRMQWPLVRYGSLGVVAVGAFWFVQRIFQA